jgi:hypothetical protein
MLLTCVRPAADCRNSTSIKSPAKTCEVSSEDKHYIAAYESHHVAYVTEFDSYEKAADFLHGWAADVHSWPVAVYQRHDDILWLWCGYRTLAITRESALEDARAIFNLSLDHQFARVEFMKEKL